MKCKDLRVVNLNINEDNYEYKALFRLCTENACIDVDLEKFESVEMLEEIKKSFSIDEEINEIKSIIMEKVLEASKAESKISEGKDCCKDVDDKALKRSIDSLNRS